MKVLIMHDTDSEDIMGMVTPLKSIDFDKFENEVRRTWKMFHEAELDNDYSIEDFVDYHNENSKMKIDYVVSDFVQL